MEMDNSCSESTDHAVDHLISQDFQTNDASFTSFTFPTSHSSSSPHLWEDDFVPSNNVSSSFLQENFTSSQHGRNSLPFIYNTNDSVGPTMVEFRGVYGPNSGFHNLHSLNKKAPGYSSSNLITGTEYNFYGSSPAPQLHSQYVTSGNTGDSHVLGNLVGKWSANEDGLYTPFGTPMFGSDETYDDRPVDELTKRLKIIARPMRMSYSDALSKSVQQAPNKTGNNKPDTLKNVKLEDTKTKNTKTIPGKLGSMKSNGLNRQHSSGSDEQNSPTITNISSKKIINSNNKKNAADDKKEIFMDEGERKKLNNVKKKKDKWETVALNNSKNSANKTNTRPLHINNNLHSDKNVVLNNKFTCNSDNKGQNNTNSKIDTQKIGMNRRNNTSTSSANNSGSEKGNKKIRTRKRDQQGAFSQVIKQRFEQYLALAYKILYWFINLLYDVCRLSANLSLHLFSVSCEFIKTQSVNWMSKISNALSGCGWLNKLLNIRLWRFRRKDNKIKDDDDDDDDDDDEDDDSEIGPTSKNKVPKGLDRNIPLPSTGEEAMKRLLACKGKDPYSILGVTQTCTDDDIKKYYKRQAFLVHPDKNNQPGAEEAFKILVHAFDIIGEPEHRKSYDRRVEETQQVEQAWSELGDLLAQLHKKMEYAANTIRCTNCSKRHKRTLLDRPIYAARMCAQCKIHHAVREGDIWAETCMFGLIWRYYACMEGGVYDISEWAACQGNNIKHLKPNTHNVQYRIVLGKQQGATSTNKHHASPNEPDFEEFLNNLYNKSDPQPGDTGAGAKNKKKTKRKK